VDIQPIEAPEGIERLSIYEDWIREADIHRWLICESAKTDLGQDFCHRDWVKHHWNKYVRHRWVEHLKGERFWREVDRNDFGILNQRWFHEHASLLASILEFVKAGQENLQIINWAIAENQPISDVNKILEIVDINGRRLVDQFGIT
jgi:hypothetical protein